MQYKTLLPFLLGPVIPLQAYAEVYMTDAEAAAKIFPGAKLQRSEVELSQEEWDKIKKQADTIRAKKLVLWKSAEKGLVFIDQVLGKHEFITYAVGIDKGGKVAGIEIIEYRETYGQGVAKPEWRGQFVGKDVQSPLKLNQDIKNLSGATLSSAHITIGVKRILQTYDVIRGRL